jgi:hypothetical protein
MGAVDEPSRLAPHDQERHVVAHEVMQELDVVMVQHCTATRPQPQLQLPFSDAM